MGGKGTFVESLSNHSQSLCHFGSRLYTKLKKDMLNRIIRLMVSKEVEDLNAITN